MPAIPPQPSDADRAQLLRLGTRLREARKHQKVTAVAAAEAAGLSRVTLHRIERGEPNVAMGAWVAVASALGLSIELVQRLGPADEAALPAIIRLDDYPQLRQLAWQLGTAQQLMPLEALQLYERNWRHVDRGSLTQKELALIDALSRKFGGGRLLV